MKPFFRQQPEVVLLIFGFCLDRTPEHQTQQLEKENCDRTSYFWPTKPKAFRVGILHPEDKNNQQNKVPSPLTVTKGNRKIYMSIRDCKHTIPSYLPTTEWVVSNRIIAFAHRFLGSPWGKHYIKKRMMRGCLDVQKSDFGEKLWLFRCNVIMHG